MIRSTTRVLTLAGALAGGVAASQAPEFAQQYRQRIGGALQELNTVVADFDRDAAASNLSREEALTRYSRSRDPLFRDRGLSMDKTLTRYENLTLQRAVLEEANPLIKPIHVAQYADNDLIQGTWADFKPAVPVTTEGGIYALGGVLGGWALLALVFGFVSALWRILFSKRKENKINVESETGEWVEAHASASQQPEIQNEQRAPSISLQDSSFQQENNSSLSLQQELEKARQRAVERGR